MINSTEFLREEIKDRLEECTEDQQKLFNRMYPDGPSDEQVPTAYDQVRRTIDKNKKG